MESGFSQWIRVTAIVCAKRALSDSVIDFMLIKSETAGEKVSSAN
jgi:hypothetical protein